MKLLSIFVLWAALGSSSDSKGLPDVPIPRYETDRYAIEKTIPLRRTHDLFRDFVAGEGDLRWASADKTEAQALTVRTRQGLVLAPLPWRVHENRKKMAYHISWRPHDIRQEASPRDSEAVLGFVLHTGQTWCTRELELESGSRLRLEAIPVGRDEDVMLELLMDDGSQTRRLLKTSPSAPAALVADAQIDAPLPLDKGSLCFRAVRGPIGIGEARILAPESPGSDPRPRWVVLTIIDALRADMLEGDDNQELLPTMIHLAHQGHWYRKAISSGCHTRAAVWPILMGRDLMRVDPLRRRMHFPVGSPLEQVYSRGNLFVSHLAEDAGYHSVFLGNNEYFHTVPAFSRFSNQGDPASGTYDTVLRLPDLMKRYHDERVLLVYYVTAPHGHSKTPRRLYEQLGCGDLAGEDENRCMYEARVRHADESFAALQTALSELAPDHRTLQILTADHGELFGDGFPLEAETVSFQSGTSMGWWDAMDQGHGETCHWNEIHVPLLLTGPKLEPANWDRPVSTLDIVPTLAELLDLPVVSPMDGEVLPLVRGEASSSVERRFVSYGFCSDSIIRKGRQLVWWLGECRIRSKDKEISLTHRAERWKLSPEITKETSPPEELELEMAQHEAWLRSRLPSGAHVLDLADLPSGRLLIRAEEGVIVDYGPSATIHGLGAIREVEVDADGSKMAIDFEAFQGLFFIATSPPLAPITIDLELHSRGAKPLAFIGPMQLPLEILGKRLNPKQDSFLYVSEVSPSPRTCPRPAIRYWWQPYSREGSGGQEGHENMDFDRVLREWGYIR